MEDGRARTDGTSECEACRAELLGECGALGEQPGLLGGAAGTLRVEALSRLDRVRKLGLGLELGSGVGPAAGVQGFKVSVDGTGAESTRRHSSRFITLTSASGGMWSAL